MAKATQEKQADDLDKRLGPSRRIVKFVKANKSGRTAVLECKHERRVQLTARKTLRCRRCRKEAK